MVCSSSKSRVNLQHPEECRLLFAYWLQMQLRTVYALVMVVEGSTASGTPTIKLVQYYSGESLRKSELGIHLAGARIAAIVLCEACNSTLRNTSTSEQHQGSEVCTSEKASTEFHLGIMV
jgi:hypothetical protein